MKLILYIGIVIFILSCNTKNKEHRHFDDTRESIALQKLIELDSIKLRYARRDNPFDTALIPISPHFKNSLDCIKSDNIIELNSFIDTSVLYKYSQLLRQSKENNFKEFKFFPNTRLFDSTGTVYYISFSRPLFFNSEYCLIEADFNSGGLSGYGYVYLLENQNNNWKIILKKINWEG